MPKIAVLLYEGFEDIEGFAAIDVLKRGGVEVAVVGVGGNILTTAQGVKVHATNRFMDVNLDKFDGIVLPGGPGHENLVNNDAVIKLIQDMNRNGKVVAAICAAPKALIKAGVLKDKRATIYPGYEKLLDRPRDNPVVVDGNIITSQGPGTAIEFGLKVLEVLSGASKAAEVRKQLVA